MRWPASLRRRAEQRERLAAGLERLAAGLERLAAGLEQSARDAQGRLGIRLRWALVALAAAGLLSGAAVGTLLSPQAPEPVPVAPGPAEALSPTEVPDVVGLSYLEAQHMLLVAGLEADVTSGIGEVWDERFVASTSPSAATVVAPGTVVTLELVDSPGQSRGLSPGRP